MTTKLEAPAQEPRNVDGGGTASLAGVSRAFGSVHALDGVDLEVGAGEIVAVVGPSGCGKTTLLELVCGLQTPDAGSVRADPAVLMPQRDNLLPWLRAIDNAALALRLAGASRHEARARALLSGKPLLCLDEPFAALDALTRREMQDWLAQALRREPRTVLLVTHDVEEAARLGDRVVVLSPRPGRVVAQLTVPRPRSEADVLAVRERALEALTP